ncbi:MAG: hypothetical protein PHH86_10720, partial [Sphaerochaetaceae bacterium]|nr:hypothetical protein [Sphaerochaetaceae bacterium]
RNCPHQAVGILFHPCGYRDPVAVHLTIPLAISEASVPTMTHDVEKGSLIFQKNYNILNIFLLKGEIKTLSSQKYIITYNSFIPHILYKI